MTEKEIVDCLKENYKQGRAFEFLPEEVKEWVSNASRNIIYLIFKGFWDKLPPEENINIEDVIALPKDFELEEKPKGGWDEYDIKDGRFYEETRGLFYAWHEWSKCMSDNPRFTAFGGWQYPNCEAWYMNPKILLSDAIDTHYADVLFQGESAECMPAIPCKIRFWKG